MEEENGTVQVARSIKMYLGLFDCGQLSLRCFCP